MTKSKPRHPFGELMDQYRRRKTAFDSLFKHRPLDRKGSIAYRWQCVLARLDTTDAAELCATIRSHMEVSVS